MRRIIPTLLLVLVVGCSRPSLKLEKSFEADIGGTKFSLDAVKAPQTVTVVAKADGGPIDVYVFLTKKSADVEREVLAKKIESTIQYKENTESVTLQAAVPANEEASVWVRSTTLKKPKVDLKITN